MKTLVVAFLFVFITNIGYCQSKNVDTLANAKDSTLFKSKIIKLNSQSNHFIPHLLNSKGKFEIINPNNFGKFDKVLNQIDTTNLVRIKKKD